MNSSYINKYMSISMSLWREILFAIMGYMFFICTPFIDAKWIQFVLASRPLASLLHYIGLDKGVIAGHVIGIILRLPTPTLLCAIGIAIVLFFRRKRLRLAGIFGLAFFVSNQYYIPSKTLLGACGDLLLAAIPISVCYILIKLLGYYSCPIEKNACIECGYNLTGNVSGICPECGTPIQIKDDEHECKSGLT